MDRRIIPEPYLSYSRNLRKTQTPWESKLWYHLRAGRFYGLKFKRQVQIGSYIADFSCKEKMIIIELDGSQHVEGIIHKKDKEKENFFVSRGYKVLRFWNTDVDNNMPAVLLKIKEACRV